MNVLVIGSGGREHALGQKIAQSSLLSGLCFAPGNPATAELGQNTEVAPTDREGILDLIASNAISLVVVGPEQPLVEGLRDAIEADQRATGVTVIGPEKEAARLEGSKAFAKSFMERHGIPTAAHQSFSHDTLEEGLAFLDRIQAPYVLKADGLAAGKGVLIRSDLEQAKNELTAMLNGEMFGEAANKVVVEEFLEGTEFSVFVLTDGKDYKILPASKDYKRAGDGDKGPNTGGMGAISPVPFVNDELLDLVEKRIIEPTLKGLEEEGTPYQGFLYIGGMAVKGDPYVVEYNVRMGDPEAQVVIPRIRTDLLDLFEGIATGTLSEKDLEIDERSAVTVVLASGGYPGKYEKGKPIKGLDNVSESTAYHAGTALKDGDLVTAGGRVLTLTALSSDLEKALELVYRDIDHIAFEQAYHRSDIGKDMLVTSG